MTPDELKEQNRLWLEARRLRLEAELGAASKPITPPTAASSLPTRKELQEESARSSSSVALIELEREQARKRREIRQKVIDELGVMRPIEEIETETERRIAAESAPPYIGSFGGPTLPYKFIDAATAPVNVPAFGPPSVIETLRPKVRVPETTAALKEAMPFDDVSFEKSILELPDNDRNEQRNVYRGLKSAYDRVRSLNPSLPPDEILADVKRQMTSLNDVLQGKGPVIEQDPGAQLGIAGDVVSRALSRTVTKGKVPRLEPGQMAFLEGVYEAELPLLQSKDRRALEVKGAKPIMKTIPQATGETGPGGRPIIGTTDIVVGKADYTPDEIESIIAKRTTEGEYDARAWWQDAAKRDEYLKNPEKYAKGGLLAPKTYATGATVESPTMWTLRSAMLIPNALAGTVGYALTAEDIQRQKELGREDERFKGKKGLAANVLYNVSEGGGLTTEIGDLYKYNPDPTMRKLETAGRVIGFGADLLGLADIAVVAGGLSAARGGLRAAVTGGARAVPEAVVRGGAAAYIDSIPGLGRIAASIAPGDVRFIYGAKLADEFDAASRYKEVYDDAVKAGSTVDDAAKTAAADVRTAFPKTKVADDVERMGAEARQSIDGDYFERGAEQFKHADEVRAAAKRAAVGTATATDERMLRPYMKAASLADTRIARAIRKVYEAAPVGARVTPSEVFSRLPTEAREAMVLSLTKTAQFEQGVKVMDTQLSKIFDKGAPTVALTPRTITTGDNAKRIVEKYKQTSFFRDLVEPLQQQTVSTFKSGTRAAEGFTLKPSDVGRIRQSVSTASASKAITTVDEARIIKNLNDGFIAADDLRLLSYGEVDAVAAASRMGVSTSALAEAPISSRLGIPKGTERAKTIAQQNRLAETRSSLPLWAKRALNGLTSYNPLASQLTDIQREVINLARGKVSSLDRVLRDDMQRLASDPQFAALYGVATDAPMTEKLIALGQGVVGGGGGKVYAEQFLQGLVYGTSKSKISNAFFPGYRYGEQVLSSTTEWTRLVDDVAKMTPSQLDESLDSIFSRVAEIVRKNVNPAITDAGGRVLAVPKSLSGESLAIAYARVKANEVVAEAAVNLLPERPINMGADAKLLTGLGGDKKTGEQIFYGLLQHQLQFDGNLAKLSPDDLNVALDQILSKAGIADSVKGAARGYLRAEIEGSKVGASTLLDDMAEQIDLMRQAGIVENTKPDEAIARIGDLISGKISTDNLVLPALAKQIMSEIGEEASYKAAVQELSRLSDLAADGNASAIRASKVIMGVMDTYNSFYYYTMLSLSPRFHGVNNLTAPLITYYTTGRLSNPFKAGEAANVILLGASPSAQKTLGAGVGDQATKLVDRNAVVVTDAFGNNYTRGQLFDLAMKSGIFKSQVNVEVAGNFIDEANVITGKMSALEKGRRAVFTAPREFLGDPLATFTDNVWRMESMIASIRGGSTIEAAIEVGRRSLFDYGTLTGPERFVSRNFFVFYNYFRQSIVQAVKNLFNNPARMVRLMRLSTQPTRIMVGDERYEDLSFYFSPDAATARMISVLEPAVKGKEGLIVQHPVLPHADALKIGGALLTDPVAFLIGPVSLDKKERAFTEGFIASKLGVLTKASTQLLGSDVPLDGLLDIKLTKNRIPPEHVAMWDAAGIKVVMLDLFSAKTVPYKEGSGENAYMGETYVLTDAQFTAYKEWMIAANAAGTVRAWNDWSKIVGGAELTGAYPRTSLDRLKSAVGLSTYSSAVLESVTTGRYLEERARIDAERTRKMKRENLPERKRE